VPAHVLTFNADAVTIPVAIGFLFIVDVFGLIGSLVIIIGVDTEEVLFL